MSFPPNITIEFVDVDGLSGTERRVKQDERYNVVRVCLNDNPAVEIMTDVVSGEGVVLILNAIRKAGL